jgi:uncharacterized protein YbjQ (UPF0145 family)
MASPKDVLVITTASFDGLTIKRYLKPVSAHVVAGTNVFSDFLGGLTDFFGGRSNTYQRQLTAVYNDAIEEIKIAAHEIGANCVLGLQIDMDEISGKGKSMFMLTAVGTASVVDFSKSLEPTTQAQVTKLENVSAERISILRKKKQLIEMANSETLDLKEDIWDFLTTNQVDEVFPFLTKKLSKAIGSDYTVPGTSEKFTKSLVRFIEGLPEEKKMNALYHTIQTGTDELVLQRISEIIKNLNLFDYRRCMELIKNSDFTVQKRGVKIAAFDKSFYNIQDKEDLQAINNYVKTTFTEKGTRSTKKQLLSSKEKEVWTCECGKTNDIDSHCSGCTLDIYGFKKSESNPVTVSNYIEQKIELITDLLKS